MASLDPVMLDIDRLKRKVMKHIIQTGGATSDEVKVALGLPRSTVAARICELAQRGYLKKSGKVRLTRGRYVATVWVADPKRVEPQQATLNV